MSLENNITNQIKAAMKAKDVIRLEALRAIKSSLILMKTDNRNEDITEAKEVHILQKLIKQRRESALIYKEQNRNDLADPEESQANIISEFLPEQLTVAEIEKTVIEIITQIKAEGIKDMGKVMGIVSNKLSGKADGKTISNIVKQKLLS